MRNDTKFWLRLSFAIIIILIIGVYSFYQARKLIAGPEINIKSPENGATVSQPLVEITGTASNIKDISLDDRPIFIDQQGNFDEKLLLPSGYTIITLKAHDRFKHYTEKTLELYYYSPLPIATTSASSTIASSTLIMSASSTATSSLKKSSSKNY